MQYFSFRSGSRFPSRRNKNILDYSNLSNKTMTYSNIFRDILLHPMEQNIKWWKWHWRFYADSRQKFEMYSYTNKQNNDDPWKIHLSVQKKSVKVLSQERSNWVTWEIGNFSWEIPFWTKVPCFSCLVLLHQFVSVVWIFGIYFHQIWLLWWII